MTKPRKSKTNIEDQLVDYSDHILGSNEQDEAKFAPNQDELETLKQTALHLKNAFENDDPDDIAVRRMRNNINRAWQQEKNETNDPFWQIWIKELRLTEQKWQSQRSRQRFSLGFSLVTVIALMLISIPFLGSNDFNQPGTSGQNLNTILPIVFGGLILLVLWLFHRRP